MNAAERYIEDVMSGKQVAGRLTKLAVERHLKDLKRDDLVFDREAGEKVINFFPLLKHYKGKQFNEKPFVLSDWQAFIYYMLFGWKRLDGRRRFTVSYTEVAKKNGKTMMCAGGGLYMLRFDGEPGSEVYSAATNKDQASEVFNMAKSMVEKNGKLHKYLVPQQRAIFDNNTQSSFKPLSSDYDSFEGKNPYCCIVDEFHAHKDSLLFDNIQAATVARDQSLIWIITTAGFNKNGPCYEYRKMCIDLLEGKIEDDGIFAIIYTMDDDDDWHDRSLWVKSNPNLNISVFEDKLVDQFQKAINVSTSEVAFKTKNLNIWTDSSAVWIPDDRWAKCDDAYPELNGHDCWASLDLSSTRDLTCFGLLFREDKFYWLPFFFMPHLTMLERVRRDHVNYDKWIREGYIIETGGDVVDYDAIREKIRELALQYNIKAIQYDRWNSTQLVSQLVEDGAQMEPFGQGYASMSTPTKEIEKLVVGEQISFAGNPVMRWMNGNVELQRDAAGNIKIDKSRSIEKVDGMVALAMAIGGYLTSVDQGSVYESRGILEI